MKLTWMIVMFGLVCTSAAAQQQAPPQLLAVAPLLSILVTSSDGLKADGGQATDIVAEVARRSGVRINTEIQPWSRALKTANNSLDVLLFPVARTPDREHLYEWIGPVNRLEYWVFRRANGVSPLAKNLGDLAGASIGVLANDALASHLHAELPKAAIQDIAQFGSLAPMLLAGRFDYLVAVRSSILIEMDRLGAPRSAVQPLFAVQGVLSDPLSYIVAAKGSNPALLARLREAFRSMAADGTWEKIYRKYQ